MFPQSLVFWVNTKSLLLMEGLSRSAWVKELKPYSRGNSEELFDKINQMPMSASSATKKIEMLTHHYLCIFTILILNAALHFLEDISFSGVSWTFQLTQWSQLKNKYNYDNIFIVIIVTINIFKCFWIVLPILIWQSVVDYMQTFIQLLGYFNITLNHNAS